jgi:hypothetical protein
MTMVEQLSPSVPDLQRPPGDLQLRTGAWDGEQMLRLAVPRSWRVNTFTPNGGPMTDAEIAERLESPVATVCACAPLQWLG